MLKKLQKKFISISALGLFLLIVLVITAINGAFFYQTNNHLESRLTLIMEEHAPSVKSQQTAPEPAPDPAGQEKNFPLLPREKGIMPLFENNLRIQSDGCLIYLSGDGNVIKIKQDAAERYSEEELAAIAADLFRSGKNHGWYRYFKFRMETKNDAGENAQIILGLVNASSDLYSLISVMLISLIIGAVSFFLMLLIIFFASKRAVKPVAESYTKQKQFVTDAGHELKTPLTVISANNELARMIYGDSEWFDSIDKQVTKMNGLVRNLITLAKMDEEQKPVFASFNLSDAVYDTAKSFENLIHAGNRLITFDIAEGITCLGDESKLRQLVSILMDNAAKYCDEKGKIAVRLSDGRQILLQVINDFSNAESCELDRVFERFYRADKARTSDGSYGLGLSIAKSIVALHGGTIQARPLTHNRVVFEVMLPKRAGGR